MNQHVSYIQNFCLFCKATHKTPIRQKFQENTENMTVILNWFFRIPDGYKIPMESQICEICYEFVVKVCGGPIWGQNLKALKVKRRYLHLMAITKISDFPNVEFRHNWNVS